MGIIKTLPRDSRFIQTVSRFSAAFNVPTLGKYNFGVAGNLGVLVLAPVNKTSIYLIERFSFSADIAESDFHSAVNVVPLFQLRKLIDQQVIFPRPLPLLGYTNNSECVAYFWTQQANDLQSDQLIADFSGLLNQVPALVGVATINVSVALDIYEVIDGDWIKGFREKPLQKYHI